LLGSLAGTPDLDRWVALRDGRVAIRTGKAELGQGIRTALVAVAADELSVDPAVIDIEGPVTGSTPNEFITAGSGSIEQSAMAVRQACAHARLALLARAADEFGIAATDLHSGDGVVRAPDGREVSYWSLVGDGGFGVTVDEVAPTLPSAERRWAGVGLRRIDLPAKVRGEPVFVHDTPGSMHARLIRPGWAEHELVEAADAAALVAHVRAELAIDVDVVVDGSFVAVLATREGDAVLAAEAVASRLQWREPESAAGSAADPARMIAAVESSIAVIEGSASEEQPAEPARSLPISARYSKPFLLHGSIGPSAAVASFDGTTLDVATHSQGVELLAPAIAEALGLAHDAVIARHVDGAGCYGHNGADDAAFDAALIAFHRPGPPVKVQWSRTDEHRLEPASPAMVVDLGARLDERGRIAEWDHDVYSYAHIGRPFPMGPERSGLLAAWSRAEAVRRPRPRAGGGFHAGAHRNADPLYDVGDRRIATHFVAGCPVRTSSTRSLGAFANVFAIESFMDELAIASRAQPDAFRIAHLNDARAVEVIEAAVDLAGGLVAPGGIDAPGRGLAFARYENMKAYCAVVAETRVDPRNGHITITHAWIAADAGEVIDPGGLANQLEGGFIQAASWTLYEELDVTGGRANASDWDDYPIMRFPDVPTIEVRLLQRPDEPVLGAAEAITGPTPAAIANAVYDATGARLRDLPLRPARVSAALDALT
jgi:CO/xanthine dehydrogenase Mo-binding subunit